jgi:hypothetical protein
MLAYSDSDAGEIGTIYQAANWVYIGRGIGRHKELIAPNGRIVNETIINKYARQSGVSYGVYLDGLLAAGWGQQPVNPKGRYAYVLDKSDKALVARVEAMRQPYPKREDSDMRPVKGDNPGDQPGQGGSIPTRTLLPMGDE